MTSPKELGTVQISATPCLCLARVFVQIIDTTASLATWSEAPPLLKERSLTIIFGWR